LAPRMRRVRKVPGVASFHHTNSFAISPNIVSGSESVEAGLAYMPLRDGRVQC
jgi:hypothetical protein